MSKSTTDRDTKYMEQMWGTTSLVTDYGSLSKRVLQEVVYDPANKTKNDIEDIYEESSENDFEYGIEPTFKLNKGQKLL